MPPEAISPCSSCCFNSLYFTYMQRLEGCQWNHNKCSSASTLFGGDRTVAPSSNPFFQPLLPKPRAMLLGSQKASRGDRLVSHRCTNGCADTDLWNWAAASDWGNLSCSSGAQGWILLKVQTVLCSSVCIRCRQPPLTLSRALGPFFCWVSRACLTMETHMGEVFEAAFFSPHLISPSLKLLSPPLVLLWVVSSNFCSPKAKIWVMLYLNIDLHSAVGVGFPPSVSVLCTAPTRANP